VAERFHCALVTGASAGIGAEFARQLAPHCDALALVARRADRLAQLADRLQKRHPNLRVFAIEADLTDPEARLQTVAHLRDLGLVPDLLINNAGLGDYGEFASSDWEKISAMLRVNIEALTHLTHAIVPSMVAAGKGSILNVSSLASILPIPEFAVYAATKAYVSSFSEALRLELRGHGIHVTALCPGPVKTEFGEVARRKGGGKEFPARGWFYVSVEQVVREAIAGLANNRPRVYPGLKIAVAAVAISLIPLAVLRFGMGFRPRR
jgi:short-subunit dehydrogenase